MTELLVRLFVKDRKNTSNPAVRASYGTLAGAVGIVLNLLLSAIKLTAGLLSSSLSIMADAVNNLSDAGTSLVSLVSFRLAAKPADREHPFGHARIEYVASMIVSFLILNVGLDLLVDSVKSAISGQSSEIKIGTVTIIILSVSIIMKLWLFVFSRKIGGRIGSDTVKATGTDAVSDAASTLTILVSALVIRITDFYILDAIMCGLVSIIIIIAGIKILIKTKDSILGEAPVSETVNAIKEIAAHYPEVIGIHDMMVHNYGPGKFIASFHAEVDGKGDIYSLHDAIDLLEKEISTELDILCTVHMDPINTDDATVNRLRVITEELVNELYPTFTLHDFRVVTGDSHTNLIFDVVIPFEASESPNDVTDKISSEMLSRYPEHYCVITVDRA